MTLAKALAGSSLMVLASASGAMAQCNGQPASGFVCGNAGASQGLPSFGAISPLLDRAFGTTQGAMLNRGASGWNSTTAPVLGLNGTIGGFLTLKGATSGFTVIGVPAAAGTTTFNLPAGNGTAGFTLHTDGAGNTSWSTAGAGTVTSIGVTVDTSVLAVSPSTITSAGTFAITLATQSANLVWSGPTTGAATTPTFRLLVGADLPNPSAIALGGIESTVGASHQWVSSISTTGVPGLTQPAFTDISGTLGTAQCPTPTFVAIGCVEGYAAVTHQWISSISTAGIPASTQPAFTDISGQATLAQLPGIGSNTVLSNIAGGSSTPLANSLSAIIDSSIGSAQGDVLYRNSTVWAALPPGTTGQVLSTNGTTSNPSWATVSGTGTVTSVATNNGVTGGTITSSGTIGLATIATGTVLANTTGTTAVPTATIPSAILDVVGSAEGDVLYRGASTWAALAPGSNGQYLQTTGAGSTPQWANPVTSVVCNGVTITATGTCAPNFGYQNCTIAATVAGNNLTIALKDNAGSDPSATSPCNVYFRSSTASVGSWIQRTVTTATSMVLNSGSTLGTSNGQAFRVWVTLHDTGTTAQLGVSTRSNASQVFQLTENIPATSTTCSSCTTATVAGTFYTKVGEVGAITILGWAEWGTGVTTAGVWASGPTIISSFGPGSKKPGDILQGPIYKTDAAQGVISASGATKVECTGMNATITPISAADPILVQANVPWVQTNTNAQQGSVILGRNTTANIIGNAGVGGYNGLASSNGIGAATLVAFDLPNTTSATVYRTYVFGSGNATSAFSCNDGATLPFSSFVQEIMG